MDENVNWLEAALNVDGELAEAVAEVLARFAPGGVVLERGVVYNDAEDEGTPVGPVKVYGYLPAGAELEETRQKLEEALWHLGQISALPQPAYRSVANRNWMEAWKEHYKPIPVGKRMLILPAWLDNPLPERIAVKIDPSMAFGTGTHPTTQLCIEQVERLTRPGMDVIDLGCGSGILSIAALLMGAGRVLAVDVDPESVKAAGENAAANGVSGGLEVGQGSVKEIREGRFGMQQVPLVLANILAPVLIRLLDDGLADLAAPQGKMVLSGILNEQAMGVRDAAGMFKLDFVEETRMGDWVALVFQKMK